MKKIVSIILVIALFSGICASSFADSSTIYCWNCGRRIPADSVFCPYCAKKQNHSTSSGTSTTNSYSNSYSNYSDNYDFLDLLPSNPLTHYGNELKKALTNSQYILTDEEKAGVDGETYRYRKDSEGKYRNGHRSELIKHSSFGYPISYYYADGLVYFAIVYTYDNKEMVKLHYWGDQIIAYRDYRGNDHDLKYTYDYGYSSIADEFEDVFDIGMGRID